MGLLSSRPTPTLCIPTLKGANERVNTAMTIAANFMSRDELNDKSERTPANKNIC